MEGLLVGCVDENGRDDGCVADWMAHALISLIHCGQIRPVAGGVIQPRSFLNSVAAASFLASCGMHTGATGGALQR